MTRNQHHSAANSIECFALCKQFIKNYHSYSGVKQTSTLFAGTHQHHEPVNKLPAPSWTSQLLPFKLGSTNTGSMGPSNRGWLPTGTYLHPPTKKSTASNKMLMAQISTEVTDLINNWAIIETQVVEQSFVSQIFLVEKKDGGQRPVVNLKCQYVKTEHFKMEGLHLLPDLLQAQDWMVKLDLKDAYLQVPIHPNHQHLLTFQWEGKSYMFKCLPFGLSSAPRVFTKLLKPVVGFLRQIGCRLIIYLDDMLILHQNREQLHQITQLIC